jgi:hypothetical protein
MGAFDWTKDYEKAFQDLKNYLSNPPLLSRSEVGESLYLYLAVSPIQNHVSSALIREEDGVQSCDNLV